MRTDGFGNIRRRAISTVSAAAVGLALAGVSLPARAQAVFSFDIPRGDLASVVTGIARTAGTQVVFPAGIASGRVAGPIRGRESLDSALSQALAGTGLQVARSGGGILTIRAAAAGSAAAIPAGTDLAAIDVTDAGGIPGGSHGDQGFQPGDAGDTVRIGDAPAREIPLTVSTVTQKVIESQVITTTTDAALNVAGVNQSSESQFGRPAFTIRGFLRGGYTVNGLPDSTSQEIPVDAVERVEVLKGPTSILEGVSSNGGVINVTLKQPTETEIRNLTARYGSYNYKTIAADLGGRVEGTDGVTYRFVVSGNHADKNSAGYRDPHEVLVAPTLRWQGDDLMLQAGVRYIDARIVPETFATLPFLASGERGPLINEPRGVPLGNPYYGGEAKTLSIETKQSYEVGRILGVDVTLNNNFAYSNSKLKYSTSSFDFRAAQDFGPLQKIIPSKSDQDASSFVEKADVTLKYESNFFKQLLKFGYDYTPSNSFVSSGSGAPALIDLRTGLPQTTLYVAPTLTVKATSDVQGVYVIDKFDTLDDRLHIFGSVRHDNYKDKSTVGLLDFGLSFDSVLKTSAVSWVAGGAFDVTPWMTVYGNRSNGFVPSIGVDVNGNVLPPEQRDLSEVGARYYFFDKRLTLTNSFFDLARTNVSIADPTDPTGFRRILIGGQNSKGVEVEAQGEVLPGLNLIASFTAQSFKDGGNASATGTYLNGLPNHLASLWATYTFQDSVLEGLTFGGGIRYVGSVLANARDGGPLYRFPSYNTVDAVVSYDTKDYTVSLKLNNAFNTYGYMAYGLTQNVRVIPGRTALLQTTYRF